MPKANSKRWLVIIQDFTHRLYGVVHCSRITGAVRDEIAMGFPGFHFTEGRLRREHLHTASAFYEIGQDAALDTEIERCHPEGSVFITNDIRFLCTHDGGQFRSEERRVGKEGSGAGWRVDE